jgi:sensor histidine kinase regulating citrate/malate metabolism
MPQGGGLIYVDAQLAPDGLRKLIVNDTGPGIPPVIIDHIFDQGKAHELLVEEEGTPLAEAARQLGVSTSAVSKSLSRDLEGKSS